MPGVEDWVNSPLEIIQRFFDADDAKHIAKVNDYFMKKLDNSLSCVPSLNHTPLHHLHTNSLVRFRCMVQDMYDPEFFLGVYEVEDLKTRQSHLQSGKFRDLAECGPQYEIKLESPKNVTMDRQTMYCVPVPGENEWVREEYSQQYPAISIPSTSSSSVRCKRSMDDEDQIPVHCSGDRSTTNPTAESDVTMETGEAASATVNGNDAKRRRNSEEVGQSTTQPPDLNFPLPGERGISCLVKVYENSENFKVNDIVEFVGILSNDPALASFPEKERKEQSSFLNPAVELMEGIEEQNAHSPPPSLVPRLHVLKTYRLLHGNPLLPATLDIQDGTTMHPMLNEAKDVRQQVVSVLQKALLGDELAAEYLLCNLLSSVYSRQDVIALGKFGLNISSCPRNSDFPQHLYKFLQQLVTKSYMLPMTLHNMNTMSFVPKKDYTANRLKSGILQLGQNTLLFLDETKMQAGQLDAKGVANLTALGHVVSWQKVEYDFNFHKQDFPTNIEVLVLSEGKSLIKCDCIIPLETEAPAENIEERFQSILDSCTPALLSQVRSFITLSQLVSYSIPSDLQATIEQNFVDMRKDDPKRMTVDDFHALLILARLLTLSHGLTQLNSGMWERAKVMETQRKQRLSSSTH